MLTGFNASDSWATMCPDDSSLYLLLKQRENKKKNKTNHINLDDVFICVCVCVYIELLRPFVPDFLLRSRCLCVCVQVWKVYGCAHCMHNALHQHFSLIVYLHSSITVDIIPAIFSISLFLSLSAVVYGRVPLPSITVHWLLLNGMAWKELNSSMTCKSVSPQNLPTILWMWSLSLFCLPFISLSLACRLFIFHRCDDVVLSHAWTFL